MSPKTPGKPIVIRGVSYPSRYAAGKALGLSGSAIEKAAKRGNLEMVGLNRAGNRETVLEGMVFASRKEAAEYYGVSQGTISRWVCTGRTPPKEDYDLTPQQVTVNGVTYRSKRQARLETGLGPSLIEKLANMQRRRK